jgi:lipopolysaccharide transport system ATP-binding protein
MKSQDQKSSDKALGHGVSTTDVQVSPVDFMAGSKVVINVEGLSKQYRLGSINHGTLVSDVQSWWARILGKEDPNLRVDQIEKLRFSGADSNGSKDSDRFWALKNISFDVYEGGVLGIIGRNGAGKSTLLKIMSKVTTPTLGRINIRGRVASLLEVGTGFHPELSGRDNIFLNGTIHGMSRREVSGKFDEIVAFAEIDRFIDTPVKRYSSGMYVRLAFAVAAHLDPEILIVDEVLAVGDLAFQKKCLGKMEEVSREGRTVLFVSHQLNMVESLCDEAIILDKGCLVARGETKRIIGDYMKSVITEIATSDNLSSVANRKGDQRIIFRSFHLEDMDGNILTGLRSGMDVVFVFGYQCSTENVLDNVDIGFSLHSVLNNQSLAVLYSSYTGRTFKVDRREGFFRCVVKRFPLVEGKYKLGARITVNGYEADWPLDGIAVVGVASGDFYGTGSSGYGTAAQYLIDGDWELDD